jgi:hypothetical protein
MNVESKERAAKDLEESRTLMEELDQRWLAKCEIHVDAVATKEAMLKDMALRIREMEERIREKDVAAKATARANEKRAADLSEELRVALEIQQSRDCALAEKERELLERSGMLILNRPLCDCFNLKWHEACTV